MRTEVRVDQGTTIVLDDGVLDSFRERLGAGPEPPPVRLAYAAAHLVMKPSYRDVPHSLADPASPDEVSAHIDWDATMALRTRLDGLGFGIAEAMDTAQRFFIGWPAARELIERCGALGLANGFIAGAGIDGLEAPETASLDQLGEGVVEQARIIRAAGGWPILLPVAELCRRDADADTFVGFYRDVVSALDGPVFIHWLGPMFMAALEGYFPGDSFARVMALDRDVIRGCKLSLLDDALELSVRRSLLPHGQIVLTGDDFHFGRLMLGGEPGGAPPDVAPTAEGVADLDGRPAALGDFSHALLGVLDGIAVPAALALRLLARGDARGFQEVMEPCEVLGRWIFQTPTTHYKAGLAFLSWLNGHQATIDLVNHEEAARSLEHFVECARLASRAGCIEDATAAGKRLDAFLLAGP